MTSPPQDIKTAGETRQITVRIPADLHRRFRTAAVKRDESLNTLLTNWIEKWTVAMELIDRAERE